MCRLLVFLICAKHSTGKLAMVASDFDDQSVIRLKNCACSYMYMTMYTKQVEVIKNMLSHWAMELQDLNNCGSYDIWPPGWHYIDDLENILIVSQFENPFIQQILNNDSNNNNEIIIIILAIIRHYIKTEITCNSSDRTMTVFRSVRKFAHGLSAMSAKRKT